MPKNCPMGKIESHVLVVLSVLLQLMYSARRLMALALLSSRYLHVLTLTLARLLLSS